MIRQVANVFKSVLFNRIFLYLYTFSPVFCCKINIVKYNCVILVVKNHLYTYLL